MSERAPLHGPSSSLEALLANSRVWRARRRSTYGQASAWPTGFAALDECLPGAGWPAGALVEILHDQDGIGELSLLLPVLARLSDEDRLIACIAPPHVPCVAALATRGVSPARMLVVDVNAHREALWAAEQALRSGACGAVLMWPYALVRRDSASAREQQRAPREEVTFTASRRLQLAAESGGALGVMFTRLQAAGAASAASLRLALRARGDNLEVALLKARGGRPVSTLLTGAAMGGTSG